MLRLVFLLILLSVVLYKSYRRPAVALGALLSSYGLEQWAESQIPFFANTTSAMNYLVGVIVLFALARTVVRGLHAFRTFPTVGWWLLALYVWSFCTIAWAPMPGQSIAVWQKSFPYLLLWAIVAPLLLSTRSDLRDMIWSLVLVGAVALALLMVDTDWEGRYVFVIGPSATSVRQNPLAVASLGGMVAVAGMLLAVSERWSRRVLLLGAAALGLAAAVRTGSRGQFFAAVASSAVVLPMTLPRRRSLRWLRVVLALAFLSAAAYWAFSEYATGSRWEFSQMDLVVRQTRGGMSMALLRVWADSSWFHLIAGLGSSSSFHLIGFYPHVVPIEVLGEEGLIGATLYLGLVVAIILTTLRIRRLSAAISASLPTETAVVVGLMVFAGALTFKQGSLLGTLQFPLFVMLLGRMHTVLQTGNRAAVQLRMVAS